MLADSGKTPDKFTPPTTEELMTFCKAAFENADNLYQDALLLYDNGRYPRAAALAVIGCEEAGKASALALYRLGVVSYQRLVSFLRLFRGGRGSHIDKQTLATIFLLIDSIVEDLRPVLEIIVSQMPPEPQDNAQIDLSAAMRKFGPTIKDLVEKNLEKKGELGKQVSDTSTGAWQNLRDQGLFVDWKQDRLSEPRGVGQKDAAEQMKRHAAILHGLRMLIPLASFPDEVVQMITAAIGPVAEQLNLKDHSEREK